MIDVIEQSRIVREVARGGRERSRELRAESEALRRRTGSALAEATIELGATTTTLEAIRLRTARLYALPTRVSSAGKQAA